MYGNRFYGLGALALGLVGLAFADFALQWQPVPKTIPGHLVLAYASAAILILGGGALLVRRWASLGALTLAVFFGLWVVVLHGPLALAEPTNFGVWQGVAEILALSAGGVIAWATTSGLEAARGARVVRIARIVFALCLLVFGTSHFLYAKFTASMIPKAIPPSAMFWAYATGVAHIAAGLAILSGIMARLASRLLSAMFALFAVLVHLPLVAGDLHSHLAWIGLTITLALTGAAWVVADTYGVGSSRSN
ncbi:MAG: DoxX family protein [Caulobacter sp.]|nr:DoxX family protein [Caulobacter sp.]